MVQRRILFAFFILALTPIVNAQLVIDNTTNTPAQLVTNILMGNGVTASNITYLGDLNQFGYFDGSASNIGIGSGVIMGSGNVTVAPGPNTSGSSTLGGGNFGIGDPDLDVLISPNTTNDRATLEFDFIPTGDSISFQFVFASEEYDEYVCGNVNDAFGFFLSGPGITGPFTSPAAFPNGSNNLAIIPGGNIPVSINTVNLGVSGANGSAPNCASLDPNWTSNNVYYFSNPGGTTVEYDGFTVVMTAEAQVICGQTYHIKIVIADGGDTAFDSGVFLAANSFSSTGLNVQADIDFGSNDSTLYEGCGQALLMFSRAGNIAGTDTIFITTTSASATNGVDHTLIPDTLIFFPTQDSLFITIDAFDDAIAEGIESIDIIAITHGQCVNDTAYITIYIQDILPMTLTMSNDTTTTCSNPVPIWASASGGFNNFTYSWNSTQVVAGDTSAMVSPAITTTYVVTVSDTCNGQVVTDSVTVTVPIYVPMTLDIGNDSTVYCPLVPIDYVAALSGGSGPYTWAWTNVTSTNSAISVSPIVTSTYDLTVTDVCGLTVSDDVTVTVDYNPIDASLSYSAPDSILYEGCGWADIILSRTGNLLASDSLFMTMTGTGTNGIDFNLIPDTLVFAANQDSILINLIAVDDALLEGIETVDIMFIKPTGCIGDTLLITVVLDDAPPLLLTMSNDTVITCADSVPVWATASGAFENLSYSWNNASFAAGDTSATVSPLVTTTYIVTVTDSCSGHTITDSVVVVVPIFAPLVVDAGPDTTVYCPETPVSMEAEGSGGLAPYTWAWTNNFSLDSTLDVAPPVTATYDVTITDACGLTATDMITIIVDYDSLSLTAVNDTTICLEQSVTLTALPLDGTLPYSYLWDNGENTPTIDVTPGTTTVYQVQVTDACDLSSNANVMVTVQNVVADFIHSAPLYETNQIIQFTDQSSGNIQTWVWDFGNGEGSFDQNSSTSYDPDGTYEIMLVVFDDIGCVDTARQTVLILPQMLVFVPNAFTPNGDGKNDYFKADGVNVNEFELVIYNRWGELIFRTEAIDGYWDGTYKGIKVPIGTYIYTVYATSFADEVYTRTGHVTLIR